MYEPARNCRARNRVVPVARGVLSDVRPLQQPSPPVFFGGSSTEALEVGAQHCYIYAVFGEPLAATAERFDDFRARAAVFGRKAKFSMSFRPILEATGAPGNTSCLVGTAEQVADALLKYYELGDMEHVLIRGFDPLADARTFGDELIPHLKAGALAIDDAPSGSTIASAGPR